MSMQPKPSKKTIMTSFIMLGYRTIMVLTNTFQNLVVNIYYYIGSYFLSFAFFVSLKIVVCVKVGVGFVWTDLEFPRVVFSRLQ